MSASVGCSRSAASTEFSSRWTAASTRKLPLQWSEQERPSLLPGQLFLMTEPQWLRTSGNCGLRLKDQRSVRENEMTTKSPMEIFPDRESLIQAAAEQVIEIGSQRIAENRRIAVALSGGSTPRPLYTLLASEKYSKHIDWPKVHVFWGDERCVPPDNPQSNYRMARETLLDAVPIPVSNIHRIRGEEDPEKAAAAYEKELRTFFEMNATGGSLLSGFDLILLGMGDNGHTASLFPGSPAVNEKQRWVMAQYVNVVSMWRITLTPVVINAAKNVLFIVSGEEKAECLRQVLKGPYQPNVHPAQIIRPTRGRVLWLVDKAAAAHRGRLQADTNYENDY